MKKIFLLLYVYVLASPSAILAAEPTTVVPAPTATGTAAISGDNMMLNNAGTGIPTGNGLKTHSGKVQERTFTSPGNAPVTTTVSNTPNEVDSLEPQSHITAVDQSLASQVQQALFNNNSLNGKLADVQVNSVNSRIILSGTVKNEADREAIIKQLQRVSGVHRIDDQLQIRQ